MMIAAVEPPEVTIGWIDVPIRGGRSLPHPLAIDQLIAIPVALGKDQQAKPCGVSRRGRQKGVLISRQSFRLPTSLLHVQWVKQLSGRVFRQRFAGRFR